MNSINQVIDFLRDDPFATEDQILDRVWGYSRYDRYSGNSKKYGELLRRGLYSGKILRAKVAFKGNRSQFVYYLADSWMKDF